MRSLLTAANPVDAAIVQRYENGNIQVEIPILSTGKHDLSRAAGGRGVLNVTEDLIDQCVANFSKWPGPVPINTAPHRPFPETAGAAPGFIVGLFKRDGQLWGRLDLIGWLAFEFAQGMWRGFSVDLYEDVELATTKIKGACIVGGVLTNRPASDVNFAVEAAAAAGLSPDTAVVISLCLVPEPVSGGGLDMSDQKTDNQPAVLAALEQNLKAKDDQIASLSTELKTSQEEVAKQRRLAEDRSAHAAKVEADYASLAQQIRVRDTRVAELEKKVDELGADKRKLEADLTAERDAQLAVQVKDVVRDAIENRGIAPAAFPGYDPKNAAEWFRKNFASLDTLKAFVHAHPVRTDKPVNSGRSAAASDDTAPISPERKAALESIGLDGKYVGVTNHDEYLARRRALGKEA